MPTTQFDKRKAGIPQIDDLPWGSHIGLLYQTGSDLIEVLTPYFQAGLEGGDYCVWVTGDPLTPEAAREALRQAVPDLDGYIQAGQLEIIPYSQWHALSERCGMAIYAKLDKAIAAGFDGLRVACQADPETKSGESYAHESGAMGGYNVIGIFAYPRAYFDAIGLMDVIKHHRFALLRNGIHWEVIESSEAQILKDTLKRSEEKLQSLFSNMSEGFAYHRIVLDGEGEPCDYIFLEINEAFERLTGLQAKAAIGKRVTQVVPGIELDSTDWIRRYGQVALSGNPMQFESHSEVLGKWFAVSAFSPHKGFFAVTFSEITERKRVEEELWESEQFYRQTLESIPGMVFTTRPDGYCDYQSQQWVDFTGVPMSEHLGDGWNRLLHPEDRPRAYAAWRAAVEERAPYDLEYRVRRYDGHYEWFKVRGVPIRDATGQIVRWFGVAANIEAMKRTEAELRRHVDLLAGINHVLELGLGPQTEEEMCQDLLDIVEKATGSGISFICEIGSDGLLHALAISNPGWDVCNIRESAGTRKPPDCFHIHGIYGRVLSDGNGLIVNDPASHPDRIGLPQGHPPLTSFLGVPLLREQKTVGMIAVGNREDGYRIEDQQTLELIAPAIVEALDRKRTEEALRAVNESLEQRISARTAEVHQQAAQLRALASELTLTEQRERSRLANILHDHLQQLLVAAKFRLTVLGRSRDDVVTQAAKEVEELIDESILASRSLTAELSPPILHEAGLNEGLQWLARRMASTQGLFVDLELNESGPLPADLKVLLFQSVRELLFNVVKHANTRSAIVNLRCFDGLLQVTVSDQGSGFDPATMPLAGEGGRGFGLLGIQERLKYMGGMLEIDSNPGQGSRFVLSVPVITPMTNEPKLQKPAVLPEAHLRSAPEHPDPARRIRVMLADDHAIVRQGIANLLAGEPDIEVVGLAADGQEAVELAAKVLPEVILMDVSMPKLNGVEATRAIRNEFPEIRIIGLSMFEDIERARSMRDAGAVDYVTKSGPADVLINLIRTSIHPGKKSSSART